MHTHPQREAEGVWNPISGPIQLSNLFGLDRPTSIPLADFIPTSHSVTQSLSLSLSHPHSHSHYLSLSLSHTHTHTQRIALTPCSMSVIKLASSNPPTPQESSDASWPLTSLQHNVNLSDTGRVNTLLWGSSRGGGVI